VWSGFFQDVSSPFVLPEENGVSLHKVTFNQAFEGWSIFKQSRHQKETSLVLTGGRQLE
jgi:hypothetical protein